MDVYNASPPELKDVYKAWIEANAGTPLHARLSSLAQSVISVLDLRYLTLVDTATLIHVSSFGHREVGILPKSMP